MGRGFFDLLLSEFEKTCVPVDLIRLGVEPKGDIDFARGLIIAIILGQNPCFYCMRLSQVRIERQCSFRRCQPGVAALPSHIRPQQHFGQRDHRPRRRHS